MKKLTNWSLMVIAALNFSAPAMAQNNGVEYTVALSVTPSQQAGVDEWWQPQGFQRFGGSGQWNCIWNCDLGQGLRYTSRGEAWAVGNDWRENQLSPNNFPGE